VSTDATNGRQTADETPPPSSEADAPNNDPAPDDPASEEAPDAQAPDAQAGEGAAPDDAASDDAASDDAADDRDPAERIEELTEKVEALEAERDELNEKVLRKAAEFENFRRRMDREKERRHEAGMIEVIEPILEVLDDFERSLDAAEELEETQDPASAYESLKGGVEMVFRKFRDSLENLGVEPIEAEGTPFDEHLHEAMMRQPTEEAEPGTVLQEIRTGYRMDDRVIRHSRVVVAAEPSGQEAAEDEA
jgi:molecular chaperone GrpE